jgi:plasmid stabilization system protein ParE
MSLPVVLSAEAEADFDAAADWYEEQAGLGTKFTLQIRQVLLSVGQMPELHAVLHRDVRRAKVKRFPYNIYYRVRADRVEVIAVLHGRRDPSIWKNRA